MRGGREIGSHALKRMDVHAAASHIYRTVLLCDDVAADCAARPVGVEHAAPRLLGIRAVSRRTVGASHNARCNTGELEIDNGSF